MWQTSIFVILDHFLPFYPLKIRKINILKNWKKIPGDIIILHNYTKIHDYMLYCSLDTARNRCNCYLFLIFGLFFALLLPYEPEKSNFKNKFKKCLEISSFYNNVPKIMIICYTVPVVWCMTKTAKKSKFKKKWKKCLQISFYTSEPKIIITCYTVHEIWHMTDVIVIFHFGLFFALLSP